MADNKMIVGLIIGAIVVYFLLGKGTGTTTTPTYAPTTGNPGGLTQCNVIPTYSYSAVDSFSGTTDVGGTDYIKANGNAPVTSLGNPTFGHELTYWNYNTTYYCEPVKDTAKCGANQLQAKCYANVSTAPTLTVYDKTSGANTQLTAGQNGGASNLSIGASSTKTLKLYYLGTSKKSMMPFGGCMAFEYPENISSVSISGAGISSSTPCPYIWHYQPASTINTYVSMAVPAKFDIEDPATEKEITISMTSSSNDVVLPAYTVIKFRSANYYVTDGGEFALGIEKDKNSDNTFVGSLANTSFAIN